MALVSSSKYPLSVSGVTFGGTSTIMRVALQYISCPTGGILKKCVNSQAVYPLSEQDGLKARERRYTAHEEGKHWE